MKTELAFLSEQFRRVYHGDPWYGDSISTILQSFPATHAFDHPASGTHSAAELVAHIISYRKFLQKRLVHDDTFLPKQEATFQWKTIAPNQSNAWEALNKQLADNQQQLLDLFAQQDDALLDESVPGKLYDFRYLIYGIIQHDLYHLGQIAYINRFYQQQEDSTVTIQKSSFLPDLTEYTSKETDSYTFFSYEGMSYTK